MSGLDWTLMPRSGAPMHSMGKAQESAVGSDLAERCLEPIRGCPTCHHLFRLSHHGSIPTNCHVKL